MSAQVRVGRARRRGRREQRGRRERDGGRELRGGEGAHGAGSWDGGGRVHRPVGRLRLGCSPLTTRAKVPLPTDLALSSVPPMAQTKRKARTKPRGNAAGVVEARGRTSRGQKLSPSEQKKADRAA